MELKELIIKMASLMSVTGWETYDREKLVGLIGSYFDENYADRVGNQIFVRRCGKENAPKILVDCHMDEIGMFVTEILDNGFLRVVNVGGVDTRILQASEVMIYGDKVIYGVVASTPPHLMKPGENKQLKEIGDLLIDTGYPKEELEEFVRIGTPVGFYCKYSELLNGNLAGKGFDDKACGASAVYGIINTPKEELAGDVYMLLSVHEETDRQGGVAVAGYSIDPDYAMVVDVTHGRSPDTDKSRTVPMCGGPAIVWSTTTDRHLTKMTEKIAEEKEIKHQYHVCAGYTGTNATPLTLTKCGIPTVDVGLPLKSMHTCNEVINIEDCEETAKLVSAFITSLKIVEVYGK